MKPILIALILLIAAFWAGAIAGRILDRHSRDQALRAAIVSAEGRQ
jgi:hypothetical protein